jgi:hypothetical protein
LPSQPVRRTGTRKNEVAGWTVEGDSLGGGSGDFGAISTMVRAMLSDRMRTSGKRYFSERQGRGPRAEPMPFLEFLDMVINVFDQLREQGYVQQAFGIECVDGDSDGTLGSNPDAYFMRTIRRRGIWPYWQMVGVAPDIEVKAYTMWNEDTLFDVIEVMHELVSKGTTGNYHSYADCGMHYTAFDPEEGRVVFREQINDILAMHDPPYEMDDEGLIVEKGPAEFHDLLTAFVPEGTEEDLTSKLEAAVSRFRTRGATLDDRRHAVRDLADVLEALRDEMKRVMLSKDESELFHLANGFAIRHQNRAQRGDYDRLTWLRWAFYVYLATIHAVLRVREREAELPPMPAS